MVSKIQTKGFSTPHTFGGTALGTHRVEPEQNPTSSPQPMRCSKTRDADLLEAPGTEASTSARGSVAMSQAQINRSLRANMHQGAREEYWSSELEFPPLFASQFSPSAASTYSEFLSSKAVLSGGPNHPLEPYLTTALLQLFDEITQPVKKELVATAPPLPYLQTLKTWASGLAYPPTISVHPKALRAAIAYFYDKTRQAIQRGSEASPATILKNLGNNPQALKDFLDLGSMGPTTEIFKVVAQPNQEGRGDFEDFVDQHAQVFGKYEHTNQEKKDDFSFDIDKIQLCTPQGFYEGQDRPENSFNTTAELSPEMVLKDLTKYIQLPFISPSEQSTAHFVKSLSNIEHDIENQQGLSKAAAQALGELCASQRFSGFNNRIERAAPGCIEEALRSLSQKHQALTNAPTSLAPVYVARYPIEQRSKKQRELNGLPQELLLSVEDFIEHHTHQGLIFHGTGRMHIAEKVMAGSLYTSSMNQGDAAFGPGAYSTAYPSVADDYTGPTGPILTFSPRVDRPLNIIEWPSFSTTPWAKRFLAEHQAGGNAAVLDSAFKALSLHHGIDIIVNQHILIHNAEALVFPSSAKELAEGYLRMADEGRPGDDPNALVERYRVLLARPELRPHQLPSPEDLEKRLLVGMEKEFGRMRTAPRLDALLRQADLYQGLKTYYAEHKRLSPAVEKKLSESFQKVKRRTLEVVKKMSDSLCSRIKANQVSVQQAHDLSISILSFRELPFFDELKPYLKANAEAVHDVHVANPGVYESTDHFINAVQTVVIGSPSQLVSLLGPAKDLDIDELPTKIIQRYLFEHRLRPAQTQLQSIPQQYEEFEQWCNDHMRNLLQKRPTSVASLDRLNTMLQMFTLQEEHKADLIDLVQDLHITTENETLASVDELLLGEIFLHPQQSAALIDTGLQTLWSQRSPTSTSVWNALYDLDPHWPTHSDAFNDIIQSGTIEELKGGNGQLIARNADRVARVIEHLPLPQAQTLQEDLYLLCDRVLGNESSTENKVEAVDFFLHLRLALKTVDAGLATKLDGQSKKLISKLDAEISKANVVITSDLLDKIRILLVSDAHRDSQLSPLAQKILNTAIHKLWAPALIHSSCSGTFLAHWVLNIAKLDPHIASKMVPLCLRVAYQNIDDELQSKLRALQTIEKD